MHSRNMDEQLSSYNLDDQDQIIAACKNGDSVAQRALIRHYFGYVKSICLRYSSNNQDAEEIINDSFFKILNSLDKYQVNQSFKGWIRTIAINTAIDHYRKNIRRPVFEDVENLKVEDFDNDIIDSISAEEILSMIQKLSPAYRLVFTMFAVDGYSHKEIAEKLGIKEGTSKSNLQDARRKLKAMILKHNPTQFYAYEMKNTTSDEE